MRKKTVTTDEEAAADAKLSAAASRHLGKGRGVRKRQRSSIPIVIMLIVGLAIMGYPSFSDWWNSYHQTQVINEYEMIVDNSDSETIDRMLDDARSYNERLLDNEYRYEMTAEQRAEYESLLNPMGTGVMGYITIGSIGVNLPIYHGMDEGVLQVGAGHLEGSSLPVGGTGTHAVISGHRGLPSAKLLTRLDELIEGDTFVVNVLGHVFAYEVDQIRIVEPTNLTDLAIDKDEDYVTLLTCTPYGVNSHRLLVRGHRLLNYPEDLRIVPEAMYIPNYVAVPATLVPMLIVYLIYALIRLHFKKTYTKEQKMKALKVALAARKRRR